MDVISEKIEGPYVIETDLICHGMITVGATVKSGRTFILYGMITGDLDIEPNAKAEIHGMVNGTIRNHGASVVIHGWVDEIVDIDPMIPTIITEGGRVRGRWGGP